MDTKRDGLREILIEYVGWAVSDDLICRMEHDIRNAMKAAERESVVASGGQTVPLSSAEMQERIAMLPHNGYSS